MKSFKTIYSGAVILNCIFIIACNQQQAASSADDKNSKSSFDLTEAKKQVETKYADIDKMWASGDSTGITNIYTDDVKLFYQGGPAMVGKKDIAAFTGDMIRRKYTSGTKLMDVYGDSSLLISEFEWQMHDSTGKPFGHGNGITMWRKENGEWKTFREIGNMTEPESAVLKEHKTAGLKK